MYAPGDTVDLPLTAPPTVSDIVAATSVDSGWKILVRLRNTCDDSIGFKAKTNAPRRWAVRPNGGVLSPGESVVVALSMLHASSYAADVDEDRHLILSVPLTAEAAAALREERERHGRTSLQALHQDSPLVSQARIAPRLLETDASASDDAAGPLFAGVTRPAPRMHVDLSSPAAHSLVTPMQSPGSAATTPVVDVRHNATPPPTTRKGVSVASRVAELHRLYPTGEHTDGSQPAEDEHTIELDRDDALSTSSAGGEVGVLGLLRRFLSTCAAEFQPWLSWKVYDVLFALTLLLLGRRIKCIRRAQQALDL